MAEELKDMLHLRVWLLMTLMLSEAGQWGAAADSLRITDKMLGRRCTLKAGRWQIQSQPGLWAKLLQTTSAFLVFFGFYFSLFFKIDAAGLVWDDWQEGPSLCLMVQDLRSSLASPTVWQTVPFGFLKKNTTYLRCCLKRWFEDGMTTRENRKGVELVCHPS